jgi:hypothetical protein
MKVIDILKISDLSGLYFIFFSEDQEPDEDPLWEGNFMDIPFWIGEKEIYNNTFSFEYEKPIEFRSVNGKPGLRILLKEEGA